MPPPPPSISELKIKPSMNRVKVTLNLGKVIILTKRIFLANIFHKSSSFKYIFMYLCGKYQVLRIWKSFLPGYSANA